MAVQLSILCRDAKLNAIETYGGGSCSLEIRTGAQPANCQTAGSGNVLATILLPADWANAASGGSKTFIATWQDASADLGGLAAHFRIYSSQVTKDETTCFLQGSVGQGSGDLSLDNTTIVAGQVVTITQFTMTEGNV